MGKRSEFPRIPQDAYETPAEAAAPLIERLPPSLRFIEPCAGRGRLIEHLGRAGHALAARYDLPDDARTMRYPEAAPGVVFVTNPPWSRPILHPIIVNLSNQAETWLLLDADWIHTQQAIPFLPRPQAFVSVGRVRWISDSPYDGKDNCVWHLFGRPRADRHAAIHFVGRSAPARRQAELFLRAAPCSPMAERDELYAAIVKDEAFDAMLSRMKGDLVPNRRSAGQSRSPYSRISQLRADREDCNRRPQRNFDKSAHGARTASVTPRTALLPCTGLRMGDDRLCDRARGSLKQDRSPKGKKKQKTGRKSQARRLSLSEKGPSRARRPSWAHRLRLSDVLSRKPGSPRSNEDALPTACYCRRCGCFRDVERERDG